MTIIGSSFDTPEDNAAWAADEGFEFELWSDNERTLALYYGAADSLTQYFASRITVVLDADGYVVMQYMEDVNVGTHPGQVYEDCVKLFGE